ncbi:MAG: NUDIX hydrolase [Caldilineaceae bacterium]|jgi:ADP-ribose pyrophosphatase YjhB (NUDIX family)|nr:NUDIX hydrolase [Caldilineaceae bacterium]
MSQHLYQYCPRCAHALEDRLFEGKLRRICPVCNFIHFPDPKVAVVALIEAHDRVLLIRRAVNPARGQWALPGGYMDAGELPISALQREVREEVGLEIAVGDLLEIFPMVNGNGASLGIVLAYHARPLDVHVEPLACDDVDEASWFGPETLPAELAFESTQRLLINWRERVHPA